MTRISDTQEFVRRFNEEEALWQRFHEKRLARRFPRSAPMLESILDDLAWLEAEREIRTVHGIASIRLPPKPLKK